MECGPLLWSLVVLVCSCAGEQPVRDDLEGLGRKGLFDGGILSRGAGEGVLEKVVEFGELAGIHLGVAGIGQGFLEERQIDFGRDLQIFFAVKHEHWAFKVS